MRRLVLFLIPVMMVCAADKAPAKDAVKKKAQPAAQKTAPRTVAAPVTIPVDAVEIEPYLYRHTAKDGTVWLYRKTPFGVSKMTEQSQQEVARSQALAEANMAKVRVRDNGDTVKFERSTPMGNQTWEKKKSELNADEKKWLAESNPQAIARPEK